MILVYQQLYKEIIQCRDAIRCRDAISLRHCLMPRWSTIGNHLISWLVIFLILFFITYILLLCFN